LGDIPGPALAEFFARWTPCRTPVSVYWHWNFRESRVWPRWANL